ncbi:MAG: endo-1,4-beta-xylanase [Sedimentisphaerales bacterium]|nr:endo-1,4-beta-xylanase [Sedimentisphaerales bacterium]
MFIKRFYIYLFFIAAFVSLPCYGDWESEANARIESIRKRNTEITVVDSNGTPVSGIAVDINQIGHRFAFGTCINNGQMSNTNYKNFILNHFEWAVCENETKWTTNEPSRDYETYSSADNIYNWCNSNGIKMRGHCLFWEQVSQVQSWVQSLSYATYPTPSDLLTEVDERIDSAVNHYKNKFYNWDVDNEMLANSFYDRLGEAGRVHMFQRTKLRDPNCGAFMNEYSGNSFGGYDSAPYVARASSLISMGAPIDGLGIQGHLGADLTFNPASYYSNVLEPLATLDLPIWVTEFDANHTDVNVSADNIENYFRICFSHPNVEGIIMWGFWEDAMWRKNAYLVDSSWNLTERGERYEALMDEWTTSDSNVTDELGEVAFRGFHGTYEVTLSYPGQTTEIYTIELEPGETTALFEIETDIEVSEPDTTPPTPDPMTWSSYPTATGSSTITMTATTATDANSPPVQYYFECTNDGSKSSGWQSSTTYIAQGLTPSTLYSFRVKARDSYTTPNETGWSSTQSATTLPPGTDVEILGSWVSGTSHTKESGSNRALIFIAHAEYTASMNLTSVTYGGQAMTKVMDYNYNAASGWAYAAAFILKESGVAAASGSTFTATWSATPGAYGYSSVFLGNVNQTTSTGATGTGGSTSNTVTTSASLATSDGDMVILSATCGQSGSYTLNYSFIEGNDQTMGGTATGVTGHKSATGTSETPSATWSGSSINRQMIIGFVVKGMEFADCGDVINGGFGLLSDLNGDCYVNYEDLEVIANYWLSACTEPTNCEGADFEPADGIVDLYDYSDFAMQWLECNDPEDPNCTPNW